ncbi:MAG: polymerase sigma-70 factor, subfamily [Actinomycetota bacterium]|jgi:RNA polymerase sigma factor (sigma-70 family)|nr:polymerase sigma-70 factor, subfamily [Actinomycetota bacterium]
MGLDVGTRTNHVVITNDAELAEVWPEASRALRAYLRSRGASPQDADDLVQECAIRILRASPAFVDAADLLRWCLPVVRNLSVDLHRRGHRELPVECLPDRPVGRDVADDVSHSLELRRVLRAMQQLRPSDRDVIVAHVEQDQQGPLDRKSAVRLNVQRHRARQRLLARLAAVFGACVAFGRRAPRAALPAALPVALVVGLMSAGPGVAGSGASAPRESSLTRTPAVRAPAVGHPADAQPASRKPIGQVGVDTPASARRALKRSTVSAAAPGAVGVRVATGESGRSGTVVCVQQVDPLPDVCVTRPDVGAASRG